MLQIGKGAAATWYGNQVHANVHVQLSFDRIMCTQHIFIFRLICASCNDIDCQMCIIVRKTVKYCALYATDPRRPSTRPRDATAAAASLAVCARTSDFQTSRHGVSLSASSRPEYFSEDVRLVSEIHSLQRLRSASSTDVVVPATRRSSLGDRAFPVAGARAWYALPPSVTSAPSLCIPATSENFTVWATTAWITLITISWSWGAWHWAPR